MSRRPAGRNTAGKVASEAVEIVKRGYAAYEAEGIEGLVSLLDPEVEWRNPPDSPIAGVFHGHDGVREWQRLTDEVFTELRFWPEEILDAPDGRVIAFLVAKARGRGSELAIEVPFAHVIDIRDGKVVAFAMHSNVAEARAAVGLEP